MLGRHPVDVMLLATDLDAARSFYGETLGLPVLLEDEGFLTFGGGGDSRLVVTKSTTTASDQTTKASWRVDDLAGEVADLRARGVPVQDLPELATIDGIADLGFALAAWFTDPDHNWIGLLQLKDPPRPPHTTTTSTTQAEPLGQGDKAMTEHKVVDRQHWQAARDELLQREKAHTRTGDELARQRRQLPWVRVDKAYRFDTDHGPQTLAELFNGRSQLLVYHFMFGPSYAAGDPVNSSIADTLDALAPHLQARDTTVVLVSQAPLENLQAYKHQLGWRLRWVSAAPSDFNLDLGASTPPGAVIVPPQDGLPPIVAQNAAAAGTDLAGYLTQAPVVSVFARHDGVVYQSYTSSWRGVEFLMGYYPILDRLPKGRDEDNGWQLWLRRHHEYNNG